MRGVLKVFDGANWKPTGVVVNQDITQYISPFNYAQNADFTQWVAQAGIGGNHGSQAYGGDRWILDSGTITGDARADGNGYENITLNGTIRQIVANPPATGTVGVDMVSGTATASYADGEITITSSGGVIKDVWLYEGSYGAGAAPKFQPKGYAAELAECQRCFLFNVGYNQSGYAISSGCACLISTPVKMRVKPTAVLRRQNAAVWAGGSGQVTGVSVSDLRENGVSVSLILSSYPSSLTPIVTAEPGIDLCADYE